MTTKCPRCEEVVRGIIVREVRGCGYGGRKWQCLSMNCPHCNTSLGVQIDPRATHADLMADIKATAYA